MNVIKRDGREAVFDISKVVNAITKANSEYDELSQDQISNVANKVWRQCKKLNRAVNVEEVQDFVEDALIQANAYRVSKHYIKYRYRKELERKRNTTDAEILTVVNLENEEVKQENSNKNPITLSTQRDYIAGVVSKDISNRYLLPKDVREAHQQGLIHFHDADYFVQRSHNCCLINLKDMLQNGTVINKTMIEKPHSFSTACTIATQIMAQVASHQYGGQTISLAHLAPFVGRSREKLCRELKEELKDANLEISEEQFNILLEDRVRKDVKRGVQVMQYQINTLLTSNGQAPFVSLNMYLGEAENEQEKKDLALIIEEVLKQRIEGVKNEVGVWITPAFPKLLYVLEEDNIHEDSPYWYLTELAAKCTAKRMVPDYISEKILLQDKYPIEQLISIKDRRDKWGDERLYGPNPFKNVSDEECEVLQRCVIDNYTSRKVGDNQKVKNILDKYSIREKELFPVAYPCMGCRSFLTPDRIHYKYYGRLNQGVVTVNLIDIACSSKKDINKFWKIFDERLELCHKALKVRHDRLCGTPSDVAPILWQYGALARLNKGETIDRLLYNGYSTISLGYAGLWECVYYMTGKKLTEEEGKEFGLEVMEKLNEYTAKWKAAENMDYSLYGTPMESTTYKFAKCLQNRFGIIEGVTDKNYITNSYHVHVTEHIDAFHKLALESQFQKLSPGGAISYIEVPNMQQNIRAVLDIIRFIYDTIMYAELNTKSDYCQVCGFDGEIKIVKDENDKLVWECPNCKNRDQSKMNVVRRTCGYLGSNFWNSGRTEEIEERVIHVS